MKALVFAQKGAFEPIVKKLIAVKFHENSTQLTLIEESGIQASVGSVNLDRAQIEELIRFFND